MIVFIVCCIINQGILFRIFFYYQTKQQQQQKLNTQHEIWKGNHYFLLLIEYVTTHNTWDSEKFEKSYWHSMSGTCVKKRKGFNLKIVLN